MPETRLRAISAALDEIEAELGGPLPAEDDEPRKAAGTFWTGVACGYAMLDLLSMRVPGPLSALPVDDTVRFFERVEALVPAALLIF